MDRSVRVAERFPSALSRAWLIRMLLIAGCGVAAVATGLAAAGEALSVPIDPELGRLLRGMALLKLGLVVAAAGFLFWRFGLPLSSRGAGAYLLGTWLACAGSALIWELQHVALAAVLFHAGLVALLVAAAVDRDLWMSVPARRRGSPHQSM